MRRKSFRNLICGDKHTVNKTLLICNLKTVKMVNLTLFVFTTIEKKKENNLLMGVGHRIYLTRLLQAFQEIKHVKGPAQSGARNCSGN